VLLESILPLRLQDKASQATKQKDETIRKHRPGEEEGMPQYQHYPHAKHRGDRNPKYHEEEEKDVA
jgi:hypothetical protein